MALTDVDLTSQDSRIVCELPEVVYSGTLTDVNIKPEDVELLTEIPRHFTYSRSRVVNSQ